MKSTQKHHKGQIRINHGPDDKKTSTINNLGIEANRLYIISNCCMQLGKKAPIGKQDKVKEHN